MKCSAVISIHDDGFTLVAVKPVSSDVWLVIV